jgi:hypothetical protein
MFPCTLSMINLYLFAHLLLKIEIKEYYTYLIKFLADSLQRKDDQIGIFFGK